MALPSIIRNNIWRSADVRLYKNVLKDTESFLKNENYEFWSELSKEDKIVLNEKAKLVANKLLEKALEDLNMDIKTAIKNGLLAEKIAEYLPLPEFKIDIYVNGQKA